ncbi:hypothetical protein KI387_017450, partial [Taxus chinensis]
MREKESIVAYLLRVDQVVNTMRGLGKEVKEEVVVQKVLRSITPKFDPKVFVIEEAKDLK